MMPPRFFLSAVSPLYTQQGALKLIHPLGVFFLFAGRLVRIVFWIRFINYILLSVEYFVNQPGITCVIAPGESDVMEHTCEVVVSDCGRVGECVGSTCLAIHGNIKPITRSRS